MIDRTHSRCGYCHVGAFAEMSVQDDMHGVLHCTNSDCNKEIQRWVDDTNILSLQSADVIPIGKAVAFMFEGVDGLGPRSLQDQVVRIDGHLYTVIGVESYPTPHDPIGSAFGLK